MARLGYLGGCLRTAETVMHVYDLSPVRPNSSLGDLPGTFCGFARLVVIASDSSAASLPLRSPLAPGPELPIQQVRLH